MKTMDWLALLAFVGLGCTLMIVVPPSHAAQVSVGVNIGAAPDCPYGYYDYPPYDCAPYGYYGPEWFTGGVFLGAGPWFHGPDGFRGHVDSHFDVHSGYKGPTPHRGDKPEASKHIEHDFKGTAMRDGRGHEVSGEKR